MTHPPGHGVIHPQDMGDTPPGHEVTRPQDMGHGDVCCSTGAIKLTSSDFIGSVGSYYL